VKLLFSNESKIKYWGYTISEYNHSKDDLKFGILGKWPILQDRRVRCKVKDDMDTRNGRQGYQRNKSRQKKK
jgi:hypothetical protein